MSHKRENKVKRVAGEKSPKTAEELLKRIKVDVDHFNALYAKTIGDDLEVIFKNERKQLENVANMISIANAHQTMLDCMHLTMFDEYNWHQDRQKKLHDAFEAKWEEMNEMKKKDTEDGLYCRRKIEEGLKQACGKWYEDFTERYKINIHDENGKILYTQELKEDDFWTE